MPLSLRAIGVISAPLALPAMFLAAAPAHATTVPQPSKTLPSALDVAPPYQAGTLCLSTALPGPLDLAKLLNRTYGTHTYGILRTCAAEHGEGRALDWMVNAGTKDGLALGNTITTWLTAKDSQGRVGALARRLGINYIIWNHKMWRSYDPARGWATYTGSNPHTDHIHMSFTWDGAYEQTSWWTGVALLTVRYTGPVNDPSSPVVVTTPEVTNTGYPLLAEGDTGTDVALAQKAVGVSADGDFGPVTLAALKTWQTAHGVAATGRLDYPTWLTMIQLGLVPSRAAASPLHPYASTTLRVGSTGAAVLALQKALGGLTADSAFGPLTQERVMAFQKANAISPADGVAGPSTWAALMGVAAGSGGTGGGTTAPGPPPPARLGSAAMTSAVMVAPVSSEFTAVKTSVVQLGSTGSAVRLVRSALGFGSTSTVFDADLAAAVKGFQSRSGLPVTGIVNRATWDALERNKHPLIDYWQIVLRPDSTGPAVVAVQKVLGVTPDGVFGPATISAVKACQARATLAQTGYVATLTWKAIDAEATTPKGVIVNHPR